MGQTRRTKAQPTLELPSLPGFGRRKKSKKRPSRADAGDPPEDAAGSTATAPPPEAPAEPDAAVVAPDEATTAYDEPTLPVEETPDLAPPEQEPRRRAVKRRRQKEKKAREPRATPLVPGRLAAVLTGLVVGAAGAAGTYGAMAGCEEVRGVSSCGGAPGFFILVGIFVLMVLLGAGILALFRVGDPGSTSFLAVGLVAVISMLVLLDVIFSAAMFVVVPVLGAVAFALAHWVTTRFADDKGRRDWT